MWRLCLCLIAVSVLTTASLPVERDRRDVADSHEHWERIVRRSVANWPEQRKRYPMVYEPEIVDVQEYYENVLSDWAEDSDEIDFQAATQVTKRDQQKDIPGRYIVMFVPEASDHHLDRTIELLRYANEESRRNEWDLRATDFTPIRHAGKGFTASLSSNVVRILWKNPTVYFIEQDVAIKRNSFDNESPTSDVVWNLDRIDQRSDKLDGKYLPEGTGEGADIYIFDTGIRYTHSEFEGRAKYGGYDAIDILTGSNRKGTDCNSHGTHCAGTAAGRTYGVAKKASLYSVRVLGCSGSGAVSGILHAMDFVMKKIKTSTRRVVISMSLGVHSHDSFNLVVNNAFHSGIVVVAASGNQGKDSCGISPGNAAGSISVAATDQNDESAFFSNLGSCVDVFAPGIRIKSAGFDCDYCTAVKSGTSMACPHVAGYAAVLLAINSDLTPKQVKQQIIKHSTKRAVGFSTVSSLSKSTPNRLLYMPRAGSSEEDKKL